MIYVYKKKDKKKENPIHYSEGVQYKTLWNKAEQVQIDLRNLSNTLMFEGEETLTKKDLYKAIDNLESFKQNLKLKSIFEVE